MNAPLLIELLTEELPPKALIRLAEAFGHEVAQRLRALGLTEEGTPIKIFATPRRLAVRVDTVHAQAADRPCEFKGPSVAVGLDAHGAPTMALKKWAEKQGALISQLSQGHDGKQTCFYFHTTARGARLADVLPSIVAQALSRLPIPKLMHYPLADGHTHVSFVRPAHGLVVLHGAQAMAVSVLGLHCGTQTQGHRFQGTSTLQLNHASEYETVLAEQGRVMACHLSRRAHIAQALQEQAHALNASLGDEEHVASLLDEVTALVEWPAVYVGAFEPVFLSIPQECLILTMRTNQKYFPLFDAQGRLQPKFLIVSNMQIDDPTLIIDGNQRVVRPRLADARFFFEQDQKTRLVDRTPGLAQMVYHAKLGTQAQRTERVQRLTRALARLHGLDEAMAERAALLAKADLLTGMVGEFPELQGIMGQYYALHDGEPPAVAQAIAEHYRPRFAGDARPASPLGSILALADKLETLTGMWGIGAHPTGDRDPFALRRHALGVLRILIEPTQSMLSAPPRLHELLEMAAECFQNLPAFKADTPGLSAFILERLRGWLRDRGHAAHAIDAVLAIDANALDRIEPRLNALAHFIALPVAGHLASANKRIGNILRKASSETAIDQVDPALLQAPAEQALHAALIALEPHIETQLTQLNDTAALTELASLQGAVDHFFEQVMVNVADLRLRTNRLALLSRIHRLMNRVADLSLLAI